MGKGERIKDMKKLLYCSTDRRIVDSINIRNMHNMFVFSLIAGIMDILSLILFTVMNRDKPGFGHTFINVSCCILACAIAAILSNSVIRKYRRNTTISNTKTNLLVAFFYAAISSWSIVVDIAHYSVGEQMITFYIVQFCFLCFVCRNASQNRICSYYAVFFCSVHLCLPY